MLNIFYGLPKTGKSYGAAEDIREKISSGERVLAVIPEQFTFEYERLLYNRLGAALFNCGRLEILSFSRLAGYVFENTLMPDKEGADKTAKLSVMYFAVKKALFEGSLGYFAKQAKRPDFAVTVMTMITELIHSGVTPEILGDIADKAAAEKGCESAAEKLRDLHILYSAYRSRMAELRLRDSGEDIRLAAREAAAADLFAGLHVYMDGFKSFTGDQYDMAAAVLGSAESLTFCAAAEGLAAKPGSMFSPVCETVARLMTLAENAGHKVRTVNFDQPKYRSEALAAMSKALCLNAPRAVFKDNTDSVRIVNTDNIHSECSFICSEIRRARLDDPTLKYSDIAVLSRTMNEDISLLSVYFDRFGIPYYSDRKPSAAHKPLTVAITAALGLAAPGSPDTEECLRYAKTGLTAVSDEDCAYLENYCYIWDIEGETWNEQFPDERAESIKNTLLEPVYRLRENAAAAGDSRALTDAVRTFISEAGLELRARQQSEGQGVRESRRIAEETEKILVSLERTLPEGTSLEEFREIFSLAVANITLASPPVCIDGVLAQQSDLARLSEVRLVFIMGANDGVFPFVTGESMTFSENERELFKNEGSDLSGSLKKRADEEKFNAYNALCSPMERLVICVPKYDKDGRRLLPSRLVRAVKAALSITEGDEINGDSVDPVYSCFTPEAAFMAAAERGQQEPVFAASVRRALIETVPEYEGKFSFLDHMRTDLTAMQRVTAGTAGRLWEKQAVNGAVHISPSSLEDYMKCPFMYFGKRTLGIAAPQKQNLSPIVWGNAVHRCMERVIRKKDFLSLTHAEIARETDRIAEEYKEENLAGSFSKSPDFDIFYTSLKRNVVRILAHTQQELRSVKFSPAAFEKRVSARLSEAGVSPEVILSGICDRADVYEKDGKKYLRIIDYKTSDKKLDPEQINKGINLQMVLYLAALTVSGEFAGAVPAGTLYAPLLSTPPLDTRTAGREDVEENINKRLVMNGFVLSDEEIMAAMGAKLPKGSSVTAPDVVYADAKALSEEEFEEIFDIARGHIRRMCDGVSGGDFAASPVDIQKSPCEYCDFKDFCKGLPDWRQEI